MAEQLKNIYTLEYISTLSQRIKEKYPPFKERQFISSVFDNSWDELELKARMRHIALMLNKHIVLPYAKQLEILKYISKDFFSFEGMFLQDFVEVFGLEDYDNSIKALEVFTIESSSEFAIRQFILKYENKTMDQMKEWTKSSNEHLRRLASEGCRPRLPWAIALSKYKNDPTQVLEIIELLKNDKSEYVRKSVANNLNDISKDNPILVIEFVQSNLGKTKELDWICKHASRTLLKKGNKTILKLFGFESTSLVNIKDLKYPMNINIGEDFHFSFALSSKEKLGNIRLEYAIYYKKANDSLSKKVFMISQNKINLNTKSFSKKQSFKNMTTRKHYNGEHFLSLIINGDEKIKRSFYLNDTSN